MYLKKNILKNNHFVLGIIFHYSIYENRSGF
jgi:hypothetical protein